MSLQATVHRLQKNSQKGFTLLELLVVISIIAILIGLASASFTTAQRKGRDAKRRGDIKAMQNAFEQYYAANNGAYATTCGAMTAINGTTLLPAGLPTDPNRTPNAYSCSPAPTATSYCICAQLEGGGGNSSNNSCSYTAPGPSVNFYCLSNLQ